MAYIGKTPTIGNFQVCDAITVVDAQAAYTMQVSSVDVSPESANHMIVSLNGVIQKPTDAYTVSGSTITFAANLVTGDVIDFIQILGNVLDLGVPSDNTVTTAKLSDSSVTTAKLNDASVTTAKLNDASVSLAKLTATGTKDDTTFLRGDNTFAEVTSPDVVLLHTTAAMSGSTVAVDSVFSSTYTNYKVIISNYYPASDSIPEFRFRSGGSALTTANYIYVHDRVERNSGGVGTATTVSAWNNTLAAWHQTIKGGSDSYTSQTTIDIFNPILAKATWWRTSSNAWDTDVAWMINITGGGIYDNTSAVDGIEFSTSSGNISGGTLKIYGFK
jgi:hypothetical protein